MTVELFVFKQTQVYFSILYSIRTQSNKPSSQAMIGYRTTSLCHTSPGWACRLSQAMVHSSPPSIRRAENTNCLREKKTSRRERDHPKCKLYYQIHFAGVANRRKMININKHTTAKTRSIAAVPTTPVVKRAGEQQARRLDKQRTERTRA